ncbi:serine/threonine-protein kinase [Tautonia plasticadhaerens]|uniref:Serine/threonine-protein kinase PknH n=1 Tax=Tautonia plasticadhaerens TaxID=2527974 RepID=A0A518H5B3_9BACT|nr:serine/threonine-protein kinase [Tautonia plasticadhaerens]QDV36029.1 Serine/threonine-protein kinase PknH [Tautonia plasticadhaerens]
MALMPSPGRLPRIPSPNPPGAEPPTDAERLRLWTGSGSAGTTPGDGTGTAPALGSVSGLEAILEEFTRRWDLGEAPRAEQYLDRLPGGDPDGPVELIYHEYCLRVSSGDRPSPDAFVGRFPAHRDRLLRLIALREALPSFSPGSAEEPAPFKPGDVVGSFRLLRELGRGGFARVFLAADTELEDRLLVVKVAGRPSAEHRYLARAPHPHIVPILRERTTDDGLQLIFMPFVGGATLGEVLVESRMRSRRPDRGADLLTDLDLRSAPEFSAGTSARPARELISGLSYAQAVSWVVARLAEALDHAYRAGVTHGDLKPSNVLIGGDGQPMLLDFNLSTDWQPDAPPGSPSGEAGGTLAYMAPERLRAIAEPELASPPGREARHRADLYALGLILREALTGRPPLVPSPTDASPRSGRDLAARLAADRTAGDPDFRPLLASIPPGLRVILRRCLAPAPSERYPLASHLADDLDRWRTGLPLAHAHPPRWLELARWARRRRRPLLAAALSVLLGVAGSGAASVVQGQAVSLDLQRRAKSQWQSSLVDAVAEYRPLFLDRAPDAIDDAEAILRAYGLLDEDGPSFWDNPEIIELEEPERSDLQCLILHQALILGVEATTPDYDVFPEERRRALAVINRLRGRYSIAPLDRVAACLREQLRDRSPSPASKEPPPPWLESYLSGCLTEALCIEGETGMKVGRGPSSFQQAMSDYRQALSRRPELYYPRYRLAAVAVRIGDFSVADEAISHCLERRRDSALLWLGRGVSKSYLGAVDSAIAHLRQAIDLAPRWEVPYRNIALLGVERGRPDLIRQAVQRYRLLTRSSGPARWQTLCNQLELIAGQPLPPEFRPVATRGVDPIRLGLGLDDLNTRFALANQAQIAGEYQWAMDGYCLIIQEQPANLRARYNRAVLLQQTGRMNEAHEEYRFVVDHPDFDAFVLQEPSTLVSTAVLSGQAAREADYDSSIYLAEEAARLANRTGHYLGEASYALARAHAVASSADPSHLGPAVDALLQAGRQDPDFIGSRFARDPMFDGRHAEFAELLGGPESFLPTPDGR